VPGARATATPSSAAPHAPQPRSIHRRKTSPRCKRAPQPAAAFARIGARCRPLEPRCRLPRSSCLCREKASSAVRRRPLNAEAVREPRDGAGSSR
jgi:hypothetical protein